MNTTINTITEIATATKPRKTYFSGNLKVPTKPFTISSLLTQFNIQKKQEKVITPVGAYLAVQKMIKAGKVEIVGRKKEKGRRGRAQLVYKMIEETAAI